MFLIGVFRKEILPCLFHWSKKWTYVSHGFIEKRIYEYLSSIIRVSLV